MLTRNVLFCVLCGLLGLIVVTAGCTDDGESGTQNPIPEIPTDAKKADGEAPPLACSTNADCSGMEGADACRMGSCDLSKGTCFLFAKPNCCAGAKDCDDGVESTVDTCDAELMVCKHADTSRPCTGDGDCLTEAPCITFLCEELVCVYWQKSDCCVSAPDCDDGEYCTVDRCENFECTHAESDDPICCGDVVALWDFTAGIPAGFDIEGNGQPAAWHHSTTRSHSDGGAARFANPETGTYANPLTDAGIVASAGTLVTEPVALPAGQLTLSFWLYFDMEMLPDYDLFTLEARAGGVVTPLWSKDKLEDGAAGSWTLVTLDITTLSGQTVQLAFSVDTIDGTENSHEGVYLDDIAVIEGCAEPPPCESDADCDDGDPCTEDACGMEGLCGHSPVADCCKSDADCAKPPSACMTLAGCQEGKCKYEALPGCCKSDADCADGDPCTADTCTAAGNCVMTPLPDCCSPTPLFQTGFPGGSSDGIAFENTSPLGGWSVLDAKSHSPSHSLQYGAPGAGYDFGGTSSGSASLPLVGLPAEQAAELRFWTWLDIESFPQADLFEVRVASPGTPGKVVWNKEALAADQYQTWVEVVVDLSLFAGQGVVVSFAFDTVDAIDNDGEGVFVDDVLVGYGCGGCLESADCMDGDPCTVDVCKGGKCVNEPDPTCGCTQAWQCDDGDPCTIDMCENGQCSSVVDPDCFCNSAADCDDGDICTADFCIQGTCEHVPVSLPECVGECKTVADCNDGDDCTADFCVNGLCDYVLIPNCGQECTGSWECSDGNDCTADFCIDGKCQHTAIPGCATKCTGPWDCDDANPCTTDVCEAGLCLYLELPGCCTEDWQCADDDPCTNDACLDGLCAHFPSPDCPQECTAAWQCADADDCTADFCVSGKCQHVAIPGCTTGCTTASQCNDGDDCTADFCISGKCQHIAIPGCAVECQGAWDCQTDDPCVTGQCLDGACVYTEIQCYDGDPCTEDFCSPDVGGCTYVPIPGCTTGCESAWECDDGDTCTADFCIDAKCQHIAIPGCGATCASEKDCDDGQKCTADQCISGKCTYQLIEGCLQCVAGKSFADSFDAEASAWKLDAAKNGVGWNVLGLPDLAASPPGALYYGNPKTLNYGGGTSAGNATSPPIAIPGNVKQATLQLGVLADIEQGPTYDRLELWVVTSATGAQKKVWDKSSLLAMGMWTTQKVDITAFQGQVVHLQLRFDTVDAIMNDTLGVLVDDVVVSQTCQGGPECKPGDACSDGNPCTADACQNGACVHKAIAGCCQSAKDCADNDPCTVESCVSNKCAVQDVPGCCTSSEQCDDGDECTTDVCLSGGCYHLGIPGCAPKCETNADCEDGDPCTANQCMTGACFSGPIAGCCTSAGQCNDGNVCTKDSCKANKCVFEPIPGCGGCDPSDPASCDDGNPCTQDQCTASGACASTPIQGCCTSNGQCEDGDPCTQNTCVMSSLGNGKCSSTTIPECCTGDGDCASPKPCVTGKCLLLGSSAGGKCVYEEMPNCCTSSADCKDGDACTKDVCGDSGQCLFLPVPGCCKSAADCNDGNPCTTDVCSTGTGQCIHNAKPNCCTSDAQCNDGNPCTAEACGSNNACQYKAIPNCCTTASQCNDGDPCTTDQCLKTPFGYGQCQHAAVPGCCKTVADCPKDDNPCTIEQCVANKCLAPVDPGCCASAAQCNDGNPCTTDQCVNAKCIYTAISGCCQTDSQCNDGDPCTKDACVGGKCTTSSIPGCCKVDTQCNDNNGCSVDKCVSNKCVYSAASLPGCCATNAQCEDGNPCTTNTCAGYKCEQLVVAGCCTSAAACNDGNACTTDLCTQNKCVHQPIAGCCQTDTQCNDNDPCTKESCDAASGKCVYVQIPGCCKASGDCEDGNPCTKDTCSANKCVAEKVPGCCTSDKECPQPACQKGACVANKCVSSPIPNCCVADSQCDDGKPCTADKCVSTVCQSTAIPGCCATAADCDDKNPCTVDACSAAGTCAHKPVPGCCKAAADCDDKNPCTADACTAAGTCAYKPVPGCCIADGDCKDADECTIDLCKGNVCTSTPDPGCCKEKTLLAEDFEDGDPSGWEIQTSGSAFWQVSKANSHSPPVAAWFGNPTTGNYSNGNAPSQGTATSPVIALPAGQSAVATFWIWLDVEQNDAFDKLDLRVVTGSGAGTLVWDKSAIGEKYQQWVQVKIDLSGWAGQQIRLRIRFDSVDSFDNEGKGVFVDDVLVMAVCGTVEICVFDGECDDGENCTSDQCAGGTCVNQPIPDCCVSDAQCDDGYVCSADFCNDTGVCQHEMKEGCCQYEGECDDANPCTKDACANNQCISEPTGADGCCFTDAECDDGDPCTKGICSESQCYYIADPSPACCQPQVLLTANYDNATLQGFSVIEDGSGAKWSVQSKRYASAPFSMYFGIPGKWTYQTSPPASGLAISPAFGVPIKAAGATLTFKTWMHIATYAGSYGDLYQVRVLSGSTLKTVWTSPAGTQNMQKWLPIQVDLGAYKGQTVQLYFSFTAMNLPMGGGGEGIYVDDVVVQTFCAP